LKELTAETTTAVRPDEVNLHIFRMNHEERVQAPERFLTLLPLEEQADYRRFQSPERRGEFLWSRLLLRQLLSYYLKVAIGDLKLSVTDQGKPFLAGSDLRFNLSHTAGLIACSFSPREVGIDVQKIEPERPWALTARRFFTAEEIDYLFSCPDHSRERIFYQIFTMKEAYVKAAGVGLGFFSAFTVPLPLAEQSRSGRWEYFTQTSQAEGFCLSHVVDNSEGFCRYQTRDWNQESLGAVLEKDDFYIQRAS
jgi:4'-phosphopantetheinyl transferase